MYINKENTIYIYINIFTYIYIYNFANIKIYYVYIHLYIVIFTHYGEHRHITLHIHIQTHTHIYIYIYINMYKHGHDCEVSPPLTLRNTSSFLSHLYPASLSNQHQNHQVRNIRTKSCSHHRKNKEDFSERCFAIGGGHPC